jgi:4-diphosphocytidyl-2-C-methyl-D-erythritol kinase
MITLLAPAKVNLSLRIIGKRPDGYHDIESLVQKISLMDRITLKPGRKGRISMECSDPSLPAGPENLVWQAAEMILEKAGPQPQGVHINLEKRIPHGAGLGGGSSDAAAVLMGLNNLWDIGMNVDELAGLGEQLGSDVPLFMYPSPSFITGRGEIVKPAPLWVNAVFVVVYPNVSISTKWVYSNFRLTNGNKNSRILALQGTERCELSSESWSDLLINDLEACVLERYPEVVRCKEELLQSGATASLMSGSGSAVFGLFAERQQARLAADTLVARGDRRVEIALPVFS